MDTCKHHAQFAEWMRQQDGKIHEHTAEIQDMKSSQEAIFDKLDDIGKDMKDVCVKVSGLKTSVDGVSAEQKKGNGKPAAAKDPLRGEPIGYLNSALKRIFTHPAFWVFVAWFMFKIFIFGEPPKWFADQSSTVKSVVTQLKGVK